MRTLRLGTSQREQLVDVTAQVREAVQAAGVQEGICLVASPHTTCASGGAFVRRFSLALGLPFA